VARDYRLTAETMPARGVKTSSRPRQRAFSRRLRSVQDLAGPASRQPQSRPGASRARSATALMGSTQVSPTKMQSICNVRALCYRSQGNIGTARSNAAALDCDVKHFGVRGKQPPFEDRRITWTRVMKSESLQVVRPAAPPPRAGTPGPGSAVGDHTSVMRTLRYGTKIGDQGARCLLVREHQSRGIAVAGDQRRARGRGTAEHIVVQLDYGIPMR